MTPMWGWNLVLGIWILVLGIWNLKPLLNTFLFT